MYLQHQRLLYFFIIVIIVCSGCAFFLPFFLFLCVSSCDEEALPSTNGLQRYILGFGVKNDREGKRSSCEAPIEKP